MFWMSTIRLLVVEIKTKKIEIFHVWYYLNNFIKRYSVNKMKLIPLRINTVRSAKKVGKDLR